MAVGTEAIFNALVERFNSKTQLKAVGRKLSMDLESTRPWTELEFLNTDSDLDTFDCDIEQYLIRFSFHSDQHRLEKVSIWLEEIKGAFDDFFTLAPSGFTCGGFTRQSGDDGPVKGENKLWEASADFVMLLNRIVNNPSVRGA